MTPMVSQSGAVVSFGPYRFIASERLLIKDDTPVDLSSRAFDILAVLISRSNEIISKHDLLSQVWPDVTVEEGSLRFHMTYLRKALGDGKGGARYIATLPGRGYCFVAPVTRSGDARIETSVGAECFSQANLPNRASRIVGREDDVLRLSAQLSASRIVSIIGAGGIGKTTVGVAVGHHLSAAFNEAVVLVDFGMLSDATQAASGVASMLGLAPGSGDVRQSLLVHLRDRRILLIFDTCEHLVDAIAPLVADILAAAPQVHIMITSREALRIDGERVYRLDALACPPDDSEMAATTILSFPAVQLFMERAAAGRGGLNVDDAQARMVASICRKLDGMPLALELAARRVETYGLLQMVTLLDEHLSLGWLGSRMAAPRQKLCGPRSTGVSVSSLSQNGGHFAG